MPEKIIADNPLAVRAQVILSHVLLQEYQELAAAEGTLRQVVELDPSQGESWRNLAVLYREQNRLPEALAACRSGCTFCAHDAGLQLLQGLILFDVDLNHPEPSRQRTFCARLERGNDPGGAG
jgi:tetratricopeptide (TPR) repeat protein